MPDSLKTRHSTTSPTRWVVCLCAEWCGTCRDYRAVFEQAMLDHPDMRFVWLDIEDQADLVGEVDVETFPTLLIADDQAIRFAGPLMPHPGTLSRLLDSLPATGPAVSSADPAFKGLLQTLQRSSP